MASIKKKKVSSDYKTRLVYLVFAFTLTYHERTTKSHRINLDNPLEINCTPLTLHIHRLSRHPVLLVGAHCDLGEDVLDGGDEVGLVRTGGGHSGEESKVTAAELMEKEYPSEFN